MLDKLLSGNNDKTTRFRRYKNLPLQPHEKGGLPTGYIFLCVPGSHSLWCADAGCDFCSF